MIRPTTILAAVACALLLSGCAGIGAVGTEDYKYQYSPVTQTHRVTLPKQDVVDVLGREPRNVDLDGSAYTVGDKYVIEFRGTEMPEGWTPNRNHPGLDTEP